MRIIQSAVCFLCPCPDHHSCHQMHWQWQTCCRRRTKHESNAAECRIPKCYRSVCSWNCL